MGTLSGPHVLSLRVIVVKDTMIRTSPLWTCPSEEVLVCCWSRYLDMDVHHNWVLESLIRRVQLRGLSTAMEFELE